MTSQVELLDQRVPHRSGALSAANLQSTKNALVMATAGTDARINVFGIADESASATNVQAISMKDSSVVKCIALGPKASHILVGCADGTAHLANTTNGHFF
jgi:hypothetical protein